MANWDGQNLESMLRICSLLQSVRALYNARNTLAVRNVLEQHLVALLLELIPAGDAAILLEGSGNAALRADAHFLKEVLQTREPLNRECDGFQVLAAPLLVRGDVAGLIYLKREGQDAFGDPEALLLTALAELASVALENAFQLEWLQNEVNRLESGSDLEKLLPGKSAAMLELRARIARIGATEATVLITGESGTGKELAARALHQQSARAGKPFVVINCGALTDTLLESELFGHEKGSFTGAFAQKRGRLEIAENGTLFLDEIGEMPLSLQVKMLRVIQQREFERVGGTRTMKLNVRFLAATNRNLEDEIRAGRFRQDLFYRLNVVSLRTPCLRERGEDVLLLANRFAMQAGERCGRSLCGISPDARALLRAYEWPGNVRELENAIESAVVLGSGDLIMANDLPDALRSGPACEAAKAGTLQDAVHAAKRAVVQRAFQQAHQDHNEAAKLLGVHPNYLYRLLKSLDGEKPFAASRAGGE